MLTHAQLRHGKRVDTQSSLEMNEDNFPLYVEVRCGRACTWRLGRICGRSHTGVVRVLAAGRCQRKSAVSQRAALRPLHVVDIPGHEKLRFHLLDFERQVGGVLFVIDAASIHTQLRQVRRSRAPPERFFAPHSC